MQWTTVYLAMPWHKLNYKTLNSVELNSGSQISYLPKMTQWQSRDIQSRHAILTHMRFGTNTPSQNTETWRYWSHGMNISLKHEMSINKVSNMIGFKLVSIYLITKNQSQNHIIITLLKYIILTQKILYNIHFLHLNTANYKNLMFLDDAICTWWSWMPGEQENNEKISKSWHRWGRTTYPARRSSAGGSRVCRVHEPEEAAARLWGWEGFHVFRAKATARYFLYLKKTKGG